MIQTGEEVEKEMSLIKDFILLPMLLTVVENMQKKQTLFDKTQELIVDMSHEAFMNLIHADLIKVRKELRELKIKIWEVDQSGPYLDYRYIRAGYEERFSLIKTVAKAELSIKLGYYVNELMKQLKSIEFT